MSELYSFAVDVIQRGPEVAVRSHSALHSAKEHFPSRRFILAVPTVRSPTVELPQLPQEFFHVRRSDQRMVMVWQDAPGERLMRVEREHGK